jgi:NSS family neurotransmitter:Na+ symporter
MQESWSSRAGFLIATLGCAVGVGNIWRFAYVAGENGGAVFLLVYVVCVIVIGVPAMLAEFALGRHMQCDVIAAFGRHGIWRAAGALMLLAAFLILSYYAVISGWATKYLFDYGRGALAGAAREDFRSRYATFVANPLEVIGWQVVFLTAAAGLVGAGVQRGIERANRVIIPLLGAIVLLLAGYSVSLPGAGRGLAFLFSADWSALGRPKLYLAALGQAFFSLGIGMGVLLTYGSYSARAGRLGSAAIAIAAGDTLFAIAAGVAIFPAVFSYGLEPTEGPSLAFVTLPQLFAVMPGGAFVGFLFFLLLVGAALTSAVSLIEVVVAWLMRRFTLSRPAATASAMLGALAAGVPSAASTVALNRIDSLTSLLVLPLAAIGLLLYVGWALRRHALQAAAELSSRCVARAWLAVVRYVAPAAIMVMLVAWFALA